MAVVLKLLSLQTAFSGVPVWISVAAHVLFVSLSVWCVSLSLSLFEQYFHVGYPKASWSPEPWRIRMDT